MSDKRINEITLTRIQEDRQNLTNMFKGWKNFQYNFYGYREAPLRNYVGPKTAGGGAGGDFTTFRKPEKELFNKLTDRAKIFLVKDDCAVFILSAIGHPQHIDHFILREAVVRAAFELGPKAKCTIYFGEDEPYTGGI